MRYAMFYLSAFFCLTMPTFLQAQLPKTTSGPSDVRRAHDLTADKLASVDQFLSDAIANQKIVGASTLIIQDGKEVFFDSWGDQDREQRIPISRSTIFRIYSMTKPVTSVAAMQLVEQGKMSLDDPVENYLPSFKDLKIYGSRKPQEEKEAKPQKMTIRDLLRHTSGLTYGFFDMTHPVDQLYLQNEVPGTAKTLQELVENLSELPLKYTPGTHFEYSLSTDVLARLIEVVSSERFDRYLRKNIFDPLGMDDTAFVVPVNERDRLAAMYSDDGTGKLILSDPENSANFTDDSLLFFSGGGGLCSTVDDYAKFAKMLMARGRTPEGVSIIGADTLQEMYTDQLVGIKKPKAGVLTVRAPWHAKNFRFGLGFSIGQTKWGDDYTWNGIAGTQFWVNPKAGTIIIYMVQVFPLIGHDLAGEVRRLVYEAMEAK
ncbi:MAG: serine hydrolase domain-containing protein [Pirellulaceae bacterium]